MKIPLYGHHPIRQQTQANVPWDKLMKETIINLIYHLDRGYEFLEAKLKKCNAEIQRI